jgi:hypothetical protein
MPPTDSTIMTSAARPSTAVIPGDGWAVSSAIGPLSRPRPRHVNRGSALDRARQAGAAQEQPLEDLLQARFTRLMDFGKFKEVALR